MRLIDADNINPADVIGGQSEFAADIRLAMKDLIDMQPTAYDVDRVIDELSHRKDMYMKNEREGRTIYEHGCARSAVNAIHEAIETVKRCATAETDGCNVAADEENLELKEKHYD